MSRKLSSEEIYERVRRELKVGVNKSRFFIREKENWRIVMPCELAIMIRNLYREEDQKLISSSSIKELMERLLQDPYVQLDFSEEHTDKFLKLRSSVFNVETGRTENYDGEFGYFLDFEYIKKEERKMPEFEKFLTSVFPQEKNNKTKLLLQILGYCISDYTKAKAAFFFIGASNSGKSTMLELVKKILPEQFVTTIPLYRLENRFNLAKLAEARVNICSEISEKSFSAVDIFKMLTSNETVTAEHKGGKPFEFKVKCKLLNAGNLLPEIKQADGIDAVINRMVLLLFPVSIEKDKQDLELFHKLYDERNAIFSSALDELVELRKRGFAFIEPEDSQRVKKQFQTQGHVLDNFIREACVMEEGAKVYMRDFYEAFMDYCTENLLECNIGKTQFSQYLIHRTEIVQKKMRIGKGKPLSGLLGIRLKEEKEYGGQDSESYSGRNTEMKNNGTLEQRNKEEHNNEQKNDCKFVRSEQ